MMGYYMEKLMTIEHQKSFIYTNKQTFIIFLNVLLSFFYLVKFHMKIHLLSFLFSSFPITYFPIAKGCIYRICFKDTMESMADSRHYLL